MPTTPVALYLSPTLRQIESLHSQAGLMIRAGAAAAELATQLRVDHSGPVLVLAGPGNNGGDALEMACLLRTRQIPVELVLLADPLSLPPDATLALAHFREEGGEITLPPHPGQLLAQPWSLIVDGLFGLGLTRPLAGVHAAWVEAANHLAHAHGIPLLALDCPSGLNTDTGLCRGPCIRASHTLSFIAAKPGLYTADGPDHCGNIYLHDLGLGPDPGLPADGACVALQHFAAQLQPRPRNSHKGSFGSIGIIGGAHSMTGAVLLAGRAALKLGAGRVFLGLLDTQAPSVDYGQPELMLRKPEAVFDAPLNALACGPGLGRSVHAAELLERALASPLPLVLDADALNILACEPGLQTSARQRQAALLLTPHAAEAGRLLDLEAEHIQENRIETARCLAQRYQAWVVLKGCGSVIATPDERWFINTTGNPGLASAGSGDVLTGFIGALLSQGWPAEAALLAACHLHGQAADDRVATGHGPAGLCASELTAAARLRFNDWLCRGLSHRRGNSSAAI